MRKPGNGGGVPFNARMKSTPVPVQRTVRPSIHRVLTSCNAGKMVPIAVIPLLREDRLRNGRFAFSFEMEETVEILMNSVNVRVMAFLVPKLALARFDGIDAINKSYSGLPSVEGGEVIPWFEEMEGAEYGENPILVSMGKHWVPGNPHNNEYIEMYNAIWNMRAKNRSPSLELRERLDLTLAPAFWQHSTFAHIVPDFDQAMIDGEVPLSVGNAKLPVKGIGKADGTFGNAGTSNREADGTTAVYPNAANIDPSGGAGTFRVRGTAAANGFPDIYAELADNGITLSLSNFEMARRTVAFANLRKQYNMHDEHIIDLLMGGITIPDQHWKNPILLFDETTTVGMSKRYASDGASLTESVVNGMTGMEMRLNTPRVPMGGAVMICVEVTPEQMWERQKDPYLHALDVETLPEFQRDTLDPEKVQIVRNDDIDLDHEQPTHTFGYAPLNEPWMRNIPGIGGRYYKPEVDAPFDEDRQALWAVEVQNPVLGEDFYICGPMHYDPFVVTDVNQDHFKVLMRGEAMVDGNTVFGGMLVEATDDYDKTLEKAPTERIDKDAAPEEEP